MIPTIDVKFSNVHARSDLQTFFATMGPRGIEMFRRQMRKGDFPRNKDGTRRYERSTKLINSFRYFARPSSLVFTAGGSLPYARVQFLGGETHPSVTQKSRRFFWMMFFRTGDERWKWMALTKKQRFLVRIRPANPFYLSDEFIRTFERELKKFVFDVKGYSVTQNF